MSPDAGGPGAGGSAAPGSDTPDPEAPASEAPPSGAPDSGAPAWLPAAVGAAARFGDDGVDVDALRSGEAWDGFLEGLRRAGRIVADRSPGDPERAAGYRHLLVLLALGIDEALRSGDPYDPVVKPGNVDSVLKWGMDCPDAAYLGAGIRGDAVYRLRGRRGTVRYLGLQIMGGIESSANVVVDDLELDEDGAFEMILAKEPQPGNWMPLSDKASSLIVRQFFYDWDHEEPARLALERIDGGPPPAAARRDAPPAAVTARHLRALAGFVEASTTFWLDVEDQGRAQGLNAFREPAARTDIGGAAENVTVWGSWQLEPDEALIVEVTPPDAIYWSLAMGNLWWETLDYAGHQTSLNGHQAVLDDDGAFRAVIAHRDPGVANWLDTTGQSRGPMIFRWVRAATVPTATTAVVPFDSIADALPADTARVAPDERRRILEGRRRAIRRRYPR